jgi:2-C-methyl-D-erythritol 4-phosphate cytidylyltransferase
LEKRKPRVGVVIAGAGRGSRLGRKLPKQFVAIAGQPILARTVRVFDRLKDIDAIVVVAPRAFVGRARSLLMKTGITKVVAVVAGGRERQSSVRAGLEAFSDRPEFVLVHDAVRPFIRAETVRKVIAATKRFGAAVVGVRVTDTIKEGNVEGYYIKTLQRNRLWAVQTPQGFRFSVLLAAQKAASRGGFSGTDEASLLERRGIPVRIVEGEYDNVKITTKEDLKSARFRMKQRG